MPPKAKKNLTKQAKGNKTPKKPNPDPRSKVAAWPLFKSRNKAFFNKHDVNTEADLRKLEKKLYNDWTKAMDAAYWSTPENRGRLTAARDKANKEHAKAFNLLDEYKAMKTLVNTTRKSIRFRGYQDQLQDDLNKALGEWERTNENSGELYNSVHRPAFIKHYVKNWQQEHAMKK